MSQKLLTKDEFYALPPHAQEYYEALITSESMEEALSKLEIRSISALRDAAKKYMGGPPSDFLKCKSVEEWREIFLDAVNNTTLTERASEVVWAAALSTSLDQA